MATVHLTLQSIRTERLGDTSYEVTNIGRGAHQFVNLLNSGDALGAVEYVLAGRDKMLGSAGNDYLMAFDGSDLSLATREMMRSSVVVATTGSTAASETTS